ncbi:MAG: mltG [Paenibacillaceae bacterium]|nr:mltG [Paenibacillaceae bacterium]
MGKGIAIVLCASLGIVTGLGLFVAKSLQPAGSASPGVQVTIDRGMDSTQIAKLLQQQGIIRNAQIFGLYLKYKKQGGKFQAGTYLLQPDMTPEQVIAKLNAGDIVKEQGPRFTIPEGLTIEQIASKLAASGIVDEAVFLHAVDSPSDYESILPAIAQIPQDSGLRHPLEGYLYPDTYELKKEYTTGDVIATMLEETGKKLNELPSDWQNRMNQMGLTLHQLLTVASLIEREAVLDEERPLIASVIYNRLKIGQPLQIDATIQYLFDTPKERLFEKDLQIESPFNTYLHTGLPPGPISDSSFASIKAALYPETSDYFYYVTKKDGSHSHLFAKTFAEHQKNIEKSLNNP